MTTTTKLSEVMQDFKLKAQVAQSGVFAVVSGAKATINEKSQAIRSDRHLTSEGKEAKVLEMRAGVANEVRAKVAALRKTYEETDSNARDTARRIILEAKHEKPAEANIAYFHRELTELKTKLLLETRSDSAMRLVRDFEGKYQDGYYSILLLEEMPSFISTVVGLSIRKDEARHTLGQMFKAVTDRSKTDDQRAAEQLLANDAPPFISRSSAENQIVVQTFGPRLAHELTK